MSNTYKLYASKTMQVPSGVECSLIPMCASGRYMLVYTDKKLGAPFKEIDENIKLEQEERAWLTKCKLQINARAMKENEEAYAEMLDEFCDKLAEELKVEQILRFSEKTKKQK